MGVLTLAVAATLVYGQRTEMKTAWEEVFEGRGCLVRAPPFPSLRAYAFGPAGMGEQKDGVVLVVNCACGVVMRGTESELIPIVQKHAREAHNMSATREEVLSRARPES